MQINGSTLKALRELNGYSLKELSEASGLSISYLSEIENGIKAGKVGTAKKLAAALGVPIAALVRDIPKDQKTKDPV